MTNHPVFFALILGLIAACDRSSPPEAPAQSDHPSEAKAEVTKTTSEAALPKVSPLSARLSHAAAKRVVAIGDLHGDLSVTKKALGLAGAIDAQDHWVGGELVVVQTGDVIDRGDEDRAVLDFLGTLQEQAKSAGGALILLSGNHELMNVARDFRYVTPGGFAEFANEQGRGAAFQPAGPYARLLAERPIFARVGDTLFVHGGILPKHATYGLDRMNDEVRAWMLGTLPEPPAIVMAEDGPVWTRAYSKDTQPSDCAQLAQVLAAFDCQRMVVGHTPQPSGITSACEGTVWRIDVGLAKFYGGPLQVLEIRDGKVGALRE